MGEQVKLKDWQIVSCKRAAASLAGIVDWRRTPDGKAYWGAISDKLLAMATHGTSDGKPWVEPVKIPTDEDAKQRTIVMVRDCEGEEWIGEMMLLRVKPSGDRRVIVERTPGLCDASEWRYCRFPTEAELKEMEQ